MTGRGVGEAIITPARPGPPADGRFDYGELDHNLAEALQADAERIRSRLQRSVTDALKAGSELMHVKDRIGHGRFGAWLTLEFGWSERTAQRFMNAATAFAGKTDTVSVLEMTAVYQLSAPTTPADVRDAVIAELEAGERPKLQDIKDRVAQARKKTAQDKAVARLSPEGRAQEKAKADRAKGQRHTQHQADLARMKEQNEAAEQAAEMLLQLIGPIDEELRALLMRASSIRLLACLQRCADGTNA